MVEILACEALHFALNIWPVWIPSRETWQQAAETGAAAGQRVGSIAGTVAFTIAGGICCLSLKPFDIFKATLNQACRLSLLGAVLGACLGITSVFTGAYLLKIPRFGEDYVAIGYLLGSLGGFFCGTCYGATTAARWELQRQRNEKAPHLE